MTNWLSEKLDKIYQIESYVKPERKKGSTKLDANENFALESKFINDLALQAVKRTDLREYPLEELGEIYKQLSNYLGIDKKYLAVGSGSDQIIELILSIFGRDHRATIFTPTFSYFINRCQLHDIKLDRVPLNRENHKLPKAEFLQSAIKSDVIYICSPNNPTGNQFEEGVIFELLNILKDKLTIIDEAYVEFGDYSVSPRIAQFNNVVILRTLSKAFGLAGARIGYLVADERFAEIFRNTVQSPYPLNSFSLELASLALSCYDSYVKQTLDLIKRERKRVFDQLFKMNGIKVFKSNANFIFVELYDNYERILQALQEDQVSVKAFGNINGYEGCIRVTIGTTEMNDKFLKSVSAAI